MTPRSVPDADPYLPPPDTGLEIVHLEPAFVVLVKPPGLLSEPGRGPDKRDSLLVRAQACFPDARIVHRLSHDGTLRQFNRLVRRCDRMPRNRARLRVRD